jgi:predicted transcriptional regulator
MKNRITSQDFNTPDLNARLKRSRAVARAIDEQAAQLPHAVRYEATEFETFLKAMSPKRLMLLKALTPDGISVTELAQKMDRDPSAIRKDLNALDALGLISSVTVLNPGHGLKKIVRPVAAHIEIKGAFSYAQTA